MAVWRCAGRKFLGAPDEQQDPILGSPKAHLGHEEEGKEARVPGSPQKLREAGSQFLL